MLKLNLVFCIMFRKCNYLLCRLHDACVNSSVCCVLKKVDKREADEPRALHYLINLKLARKVCLPHWRAAAFVYIENNAGRYGNEAHTRNSFKLGGRFETRRQDVGNWR